jgi:hypothetical protein
LPSGGASIAGTITGSNVANNGSDGFDIEGYSLLTIVASVASGNGLYGVYESLVQNGLLAIRNTASTNNAGGDFDSAGTGTDFLTQDTFASFNGGATASIFSDGTNQIYVTGQGNAPTKLTTY